LNSKHTKMAISTATLPLTVWISDGRQDHFTTTPGQGESDARDARYLQSGVTGYIYAQQVPGTVPLQLYWNDARKDNYTAAHPAGISDATNAGYRFIRTLGYVYPADGSQPAGSIPLKVFWHSQRNDNATVADKNSFEDMANIGYQFIRDDSFVMPSAAPLYVPPPPYAGNYSVWGTQADGSIFYRYNVSAANPRGTSWQTVDGNAKKIAVGPHSVWAINASGAIFCRQGVTAATPMGTSWANVGGSLADIAVGHAGQVIGLMPDDQIFIRHTVSKENPAGTAWGNVQGSLMQIDIGHNQVFGVQRSQQIFRRPCPKMSHQGHVLDAAGWDSGALWQNVPGAAVCVSVGADDNVWAVNSAGQTYRMDGGSWQAVPGVMFKQVAVADHNLIWGVNPSGQIFCSQPGNPNSFQSVDGALATVSVGRAPRA